MLPDQNPYQTVTFSKCKERCWISCGFRSPEMRQFCLFMKPFNQKWTSSLKMIVFAKIGIDFQLNQWIVDGANGHLASVVGSIESCKEKDLSLYAKFSKLSCEKGQVFVHDDELRDLDCSLTFSRTATTFSSKRAFQRRTTVGWSTSEPIVWNLLTIRLVVPSVRRWFWP